MRKWTNKVFLFGLLCCVLAIGLIFYPMASNWIWSNQRTRVITQYENAVDTLQEENYVDSWEKAEAYNQELFEQSCSIAGFSINSAPLPSDDVLNSLDVSGDGTLATIEMPTLGILLPVYYGTQSKTLTNGVGVVEGSSLPIGGKGTHSVIAGHSALASSRLFSDIDQLEVGDKFYIRVLNEVLTYEVDQITVVLPDDVSNIAIDPTRDYITLLTCTPYGVNSHRLLVRGERVFLSEPQDDTSNEKRHESSWWTNYQYGILIGISIYLVGLVILIFVRIIWKIKRKVTHGKD